MVTSVIVVCTAALAAGNITAAFGSVSAPREVVAGPRPSSASPFSRWLSVRGHEAGLANVTGSRSQADGPGDRTIAVGNNPVAVAVDEATHTVYVGNGNDGTVSVINTATCNAVVSSGCGQTPPTITLGSAAPPGPVDAAVDQATDTVYVVNAGSDTVSVIDGKTCNATVTSGCGNIPPTVTVGSGPDGLAVDQATDTVYVANVNANTVSVIDGATCNATITTGCSQTPATIAVGVQPAVPAVDQATDTVYVPNSNPGGAASVSVINGATCNAAVTTGCGNTPPAVSVGFNTTPFAAAVDQATDTIYTVAFGPSLGSVYVINGSICNGTVTSGCGQAPPTVTVGSDPIGVIVNPVTRSVFVLNEEDSTISVIDGATCNAADTAGCTQRPPEVATGFNPGYLDADLATDTVYVSNQNENTVSVLDGAACTQAHRSGCRHAAPTTTAGIGAALAAVNQATSTVYVTNQVDNTVSVINGATCNASVTSGCSHSPPVISVGTDPSALAVDQATNTVYVANGFYNFLPSASVSVIDGVTCNASVTSGCGQTPQIMATGGTPIGIAVDQTTDTVYVSSLIDSSTEVFNGATCNATHHSGCGQTPASVPVGGWPEGVAVNQSTSTVYVPDNVDAEVSFFGPPLS